MSGANTVASDNGFAGEVQALTEALRAECNDPADAVRLLLGLAAFQPVVTPGSVGTPIATVQAAVAQLFRNACLTSLARACADYQPSSYNDAQTLLSAVVAVFDTQLEETADQALDASYLALRALRASVVNDLLTRGALLAQLVTVQTKAPTPSLVLAYRLYGDATRCDELFLRAGCEHAGFLPTSFQALSS